MAVISKVTTIDNVTYDIKDSNAYVKPSGGIPANDIAQGVIPTIPSNVSAFTNDSGYLTLATLPIYDGTVV
jgi:hypothetical protein